MLGAYQQRADQVGERVPGDLTVSVVRFVQGEIRLYAKDSFIGTVLDDAAIARPAVHHVQEFDVTVAAEQVRQPDGDVIFTGTHGDPAETDAPAVVGGAVEAPARGCGRQVHEVDDDIWLLGTGVGAASLVLDQRERTPTD